MLLYNKATNITLLKLRRKGWLMYVTQKCDAQHAGCYFVNIDSIVLFLIVFICIDEGDIL
jgi:hypothetical protein